MRTRRHDTSGSRRTWLALGLSTLVVLAGCGSHRSEGVHTPLSPVPIGEAECGSCGMIVREQPAPRTQIAHRDGTHVWFCSVADLVAYLGAPTSHGHVESIWVETLASGADPTAQETGEHAWAPVGDAGFVLGVARVGIMGTPVLAYATPAEAEAEARRLGGQAARWDEVQAALGSAH